MYKSFHLPRYSSNGTSCKLSLQTNNTKNVGILQRRTFTLNSRSYVNTNIQTRNVPVSNNTQLKSNFCNIARTILNSSLHNCTCQTHLERVIHKDIIRLYSTYNATSSKVAGKSVSKLELTNNKTTVFLRRAWALNIRNPVPKQLLYYFIPAGHPSVVSQQPRWLPTTYYLPPKTLTNSEMLLYLLLLLLALLTLSSMQNLDFEKLEQDKSKLERLYKLLMFSNTYTVPPVTDVLKLPVQLFLWLGHIFGPLVNLNAGDYAVYKGIINSLHNIVNSAQEPATHTMALECLAMLATHESVRQRIIELGTVPVVLDALKANADSSDTARVRFLAKMTNEPSLCTEIGLHPKFLRSLRQQVHRTSVTFQAKVQTTLMVDVTTKYSPLKLLSAQVLENLAAEAYNNPALLKVLTQDIEPVIFIDKLIDSPNEDTHYHYRNGVLMLQELMNQQEGGKKFESVFKFDAIKAVNEEEDAPAMLYNMAAAFWGIVLWSGMRGAWTLAFKPQYKPLNLTRKQKFKMVGRCIIDSLIITVGIFNLPKLFTIHQNFRLPHWHTEKIPEWLSEIPVAGTLLSSMHSFTGQWDELRTSHLLTFGGLGWAYYAMFNRFRGYWLLPCLLFQLKCYKDQHREELSGLGLKLGILLKDDDDEDEEDEKKEDTKDEKPKPK